jgi:hypothetical protein
MEFRTKVDIPRATFSIAPCERMLFVGSCFADNMGRRFAEDKFRAVVNPFGVMYNPASIMHTVARYEGEAPRVAVFTLGTNHVYVLKETGEIVDNCNKRPQRLFDERELSVAECVDYLSAAVRHLQSRCAEVKVIVTVSPIRYAKYGYHGSALSKATLLLAADQLEKQMPGVVTYFPAYEIVNDELRDYRFYRPDMLHPTEQTVDYIRERFAETFFADDTRRFLTEWLPIKAALGHRPFNPESPEYKAFMQQTQEKLHALAQKWEGFEI